MYESVVSSKGQVVIPADLRKESGIKAGEKIVFARIPEGIMLVHVPKDVKSLLALLRGSTKGIGVKSGDVKKLRIEDDRKREKKFDF